MNDHEDNEFYFSEGATLIAVIIPFYNEITLINRAVSSVLIQHDDAHVIEFEIIICNDGNYTKEEILGAIASAAHKSLHIIKNLGQKGPGGARNCGLNHATGDYIAFLDADDYWLPGKISRQLDMIDLGCSFVTTAYQFENVRNTIVPPESIRKSIDIFKKLGIGTSTVLAKRSLCDKYRFKDVRFSQDIDYWFRLAQSNNFKYGAVRDVFVIYSLSGSTRNKVVQLVSFWKVLNLNNINIITKLIIILNYSVRGIYNYYFRYGIKLKNIFRLCG